MLDSRLLEKARDALARWQRGDLSALEPLLDPTVELLWWEPGDWDCHGPDAVVALLRDRARRGGRRAAVELLEAGADSLIVARKGTVRSGPESGTRAGTLVTFRNGKVVAMRQFRSADEALEAARKAEAM